MIYQRISPDVPHPVRATPGSAGLDLTNTGRGTIHISPGVTHHIHTGIRVAIPEGHVGLLFVRSSLGVKRGLVLANGTGVIDSDYRGEIIAVLHNTSNGVQAIEQGERVAQLVVVPCWMGEPTEGDLENTSRGTGRFGSTGTH